MSRDGIYSYIHLDDPKKVLYTEQWKQEPLPFDDIETHNLIEATSTIFPKLFLDPEEEDEETIPIQPDGSGNKIYKSRSIHEKVWTDLSLVEKFLNESSELNKTKDRTLVPPLRFEQEFGELTLADFLSNGYNNLHEDHLDTSVLSPNDSIPQRMIRPRDISLSSTGDNTFIRNVSSSTNAPLQTPRTGRVRQVSTTDKNFQTPISRIMR